MRSALAWVLSLALLTGTQHGLSADPPKAAPTKPAEADRKPGDGPTEPELGLAHALSSAEEAIPGAASHKVPWKPGTDKVGKGKIVTAVKDMVAYDQGNSGSCTCQAVALAMSAEIARSEKRVLGDVEDAKEKGNHCSGFYLWNRLNKGSNRGSSLTDALEVASLYGCPSYQVIPAPENRWDKTHGVTSWTTTFESKERRAQAVDALKRRVESYSRLATLEEIKQAIDMDKVVPVAVRVRQNETNRRWRNGDTCRLSASTDETYTREDYVADEKAWRAASDDWRTKDRLLDTNHIVTCIGYDDDRKAVLLLNSWGKKWRSGGRIWVSYDLFDPAKWNPNNTDAFLGSAFVINTVLVNNKPVADEPSPVKLDPGEEFTKEGLRRPYTATIGADTYPGRKSVTWYLDYASFKNPVQTEEKITFNVLAGMPVRVEVVDRDGKTHTFVEFAEGPGKSPPRK